METEKSFRLESALSRELDSIKFALDKSAIVAVTDAKGRIVHVNDKFCEISKYSKSELLGKDHRIINSGFHPREFFRDMWAQISQGKVWVGEIKNRAKDESQYWVHTTIVPTLDARGVPIQYVSIRFEITQRKLAEDRVREYAKRLEESNRELQDFASIAAHDLQEPLRKIQTFSDRAIAKCAQGFWEEGMELIRRAQKSAGRMQTLINDLLTYSRVTSKERQFDSTNLNEAIQEVLSDFELRIEQTRAKVIVDDLGSIKADSIQMRQLFQNLISNAIKFQQPGSAPLIRISSSRMGNQLNLTVTDNGIGFDEKYLDKIFTIFQRLHSREEFEGTGLGLAVCRRIIERHGGSITASSQPGKGATFTIVLPIEQRASI